MRKLAIYHLETLLWIARLGTFRAAAERLGTTQPAISARVREIESQLGVDVFRREGRGVVLTARGRQLVKDCEPLLAGFERADGRGRLCRGQRGGADRRGRDRGGQLSAALRGRSVARNAGVTLEVELDLTARMLQQLLGGTRDMVFLAGPVASPGVQTTPIGAVRLVWLASPAVVAAGGFAQALPVWSVGEHSPIHRVMQASLTERGVPVRSVNSRNNVQTMIAIIAGGAGAALFPETMVRGALADGLLAPVLPPPAARIEFQAAIRAGERDPVILELFRRAETLRID